MEEAPSATSSPELFILTQIIPVMLGKESRDWNHCDSLCLAVDVKRINIFSSGDMLIEEGGLPLPPGGSAGKESACNMRDLGSIPGLGRSRGEGNDYPLQYSGLENSLDCIVHGITKRRTQLSDFHFTYSPYMCWNCGCSYLYEFSRTGFIPPSTLPTNYFFSKVHWTKILFDFVNNLIKNKLENEKPNGK